jgi:hypothetical protein
MTRHLSHRRLLASLAVVAFVAASCGSDDDSGDTATTDAAEVTEATEATETTEAMTEETAPAATEAPTTEPAATFDGDLSADNQMSHWWTNDNPREEARWYVVDVYKSGGNAGE